MKKITDKYSGESLYYEKDKSGLSIYIMPRADYIGSFAIFATKYGSVDSEFVVPGDTAATKVPDGIAHYLEHKMFDQPDGSNIFDKFSRFGGEANAFTSFNMTAYLFSATEHFYENLETLMDFVQSPYFTAESVQKEQGIIAQEIGMYDDNAPWRLFFNFLGLLYHNNPVKLDIAGTVESIAKIDEKLLYKCYNTFYNLSNMTLFVTGNLDAEKALSVIKNNIKNSEPFKEEIKRIYPDEPKSVAGKFKTQKISVAMPMFMIGWKDNDVGFSGKPLLKKTLEMEILLEMIFGKSSRLYNELYNEGLINQSFSVEYAPQKDYSYAEIDGQSKNPKEVYERVTKHIKNLKKEGIKEEDFNRIKKVIWGDYIRSFNDIEGYAHTFVTMSLLDINYFDYYSEYQKITFSDIVNRFNKEFDEDLCVMSEIQPE